MPLRRHLLPMALLFVACAGHADREPSPPSAPVAESARPTIEVPDVALGSTDEPSDAAPLVVALDEIRLGAGPAIVTLATGRVRATDRQGQDGFLILPLREPPEGLPPTPAAVPLAVHPDVPYRTFAEVLYTLGQAERVDFELLVRRDGHPAALAIALPSLPRRMLIGAIDGDDGAMADVLSRGATSGDIMAEAEGVGVASSSGGGVPRPRTERRRADVPEPSEEAHESLDLRATLTDAGILITGSGGHLAPGCRQIQRGSAAMTLPRVNGDLDLPGLQRCLAEVKGEFPEEELLIVSADPAVRFADVAAVIAASRGMGDAALFPRTLLSVGWH